MIKHFLPDVPLPGSGGSSPKTTKSVPRKDADFKDTSLSIADVWDANPQITLRWMTPAKYRVLVNNYDETLTDRHSTGGDRPSQTFNLVSLDKLSHDGVKEVRTYIQKKYKSAGAQAQYARYGIIKENNTWMLPRDRNKRLLALKLMKAAIENDGFTNEEFGAIFWADIYDGYNQGLKTANATDGAVSEKVASKNELKEEITKVMFALRYVIRGNYPDTYAAEFRKWGWQKEDY